MIARDYVESISSTEQLDHGQYGSLVLRAA
jgi:hypothetical protein